MMERWQRYSEHRLYPPPLYDDGVYSIICTIKDVVGRLLEILSDVNGITSNQVLYIRFNNEW